MRSKPDIDPFIGYVWNRAVCTESTCISIDQTSFRTKGNAVVFGLIKLYTKESTMYVIVHIYTHSFSDSHWLFRVGDDGGGVGQRWGRYQLNMSYTYNTTFFWSEKE